ncbi:uncharacterized protein LOC119072378 [Bradysia coprophila]|uniref:uncharacterized protein LOC119072378 n=1 Tax=Bradysia coprophila TaxID=38358 RepID=UPI00187D9A9E|nr:uncharacterized protein LOC119072378 [Bradysia coprophila]
MRSFALFFILLSSFNYISTEISAPVVEYVETETHPPPPRPYVFSYAAGRSPGTFDRTHSEVSDGSGVVRGTYSYVDPRQQIRTVEYVADKSGFYPLLSHPVLPPQQSEAVRKATDNHNRLYNQIAEQHEHGEGFVSPSDTKAVAYAKQKHLNAFERIAAEHAQIAEERRVAEELKAAENGDHLE